MSEYDDWYDHGFSMAKQSYEAKIEDLKAQLAEMTEHCSIWMDGCHEAEAEVRRYRMALEKIANMDYRGNRSIEMGIAYQALHPAPSATEGGAKHPKPSREQMLAVANKLKGDKL